MKNTRNFPLSAETTVFFATFSPWVNGVRLPTNGSVEPMVLFLKDRIREFVLLDQPIPKSDFLLPRYEVYRKHQKVYMQNSPWMMQFLLPFLAITNIPKTQISFKIRDFFSVLIWPYVNKSSYDIFIGLESVNTLAGAVLRALGKVKTVVYYVSDYSPNRYANRVFNAVYLWLDRQAATKADYVWDVSQAIHPARIAAGLHASSSAPVIHVPNGLYPNQVCALPLHRIHRDWLVYLGTLGEENGPDLAIEAISLLKEKYPNIRLMIIGGSGEDIARLKKLARQYKVKQHIHFYGFVRDAGKASKLIGSCTIALAPYRAIPGSPRYYADAGKIRIYAGAGVPIVTTFVPPLGKLAQQTGAALIVPDNAGAFAAAIEKIFSNRNLYLQMRRAAIQFAKDSTWEQTFTTAFAHMRGGV